MLILAGIFLKLQTIICQGQQTRCKSLGGGLTPLQPILASRRIVRLPLCKNSRACDFRLNKARLAANRAQQTDLGDFLADLALLKPRLLKNWSCLTSILTHYSSNADTRGPVCEIDLGRCTTSISLRHQCGQGGGLNVRIDLTKASILISYFFPARADAEGIHPDAFLLCRGRIRKRYFGVLTNR
eukprot:sb/3471414/